MMRKREVVTKGKPVLPRTGTVMPRTKDKAKVSKYPSRKGGGEGCVRKFGRVVFVEERKTGGE
jgi:hypothetical protein